MSWKIPGTLVCVAALAIAAPSVGTVNSAGSIKINQTAVPASAAVSFPMGLRDKVSTTDSEAVIRLEQFGAIITLWAHSTVLTGETQGKPFVRLLAGTLHYQLTDASKLLIFKENEAVLGALEGVVTITGRRKTPIILLSAGGAAAVISTVALVRRSPSCPAGQTCP
jgi:hypothetical protein